MVLNDAGGWLNGDVVAGWLAVVAAGVAVGVGVGVGGGGVVTRAGAAGLAVPVRGRGGAVTVTVGIETLGSVCGAACGASGAACGPCEAGASDAGGVVVGGVSDGVGGVCDDAAPAKQSATSAELLRRSKRLVEIDMTPPRPHGKQPRHSTSMHHGESTPCGVSARPSLARGSAGTRSMSGSGRCARRKERALGFGEVERDGRLGPQAAEDSRQRQGRRLGKY
jgi:hypothetical protein